MNYDVNELQDPNKEPEGGLTDVADLSRSGISKNKKPHKRIK